MAGRDPRRRRTADQTAGHDPQAQGAASFQIDRNGWVTNGGLYFGLKSKSTKTFKKVSFTVTNVKNIRFGKATPTGGKVTRKTSKSVTVYDKSLAGKAKLGVKVRTHLLNTRNYRVKFSVRGEGWNCAVDQGTWGARLLSHSADRGGHASPQSVSRAAR
ncbi:hypothetical protein SALBM135S_00667 [Streptomyces alboniger]